MEQEAEASSGQGRDKRATPTAVTVGEFSWLHSWPFSAPLLTPSLGYYSSFPASKTEKQPMSCALSLILLAFPPLPQSQRFSPPVPSAAPLLQDKSSVPVRRLDYRVFLLPSSVHVGFSESLWATPVPFSPPPLSSASLFRQDLPFLYVALITVPSEMVPIPPPPTPWSLSLSPDLGISRG